MGDIINFEKFKGEKALDDEFPEFLANAEKIFNAKTNPESLFKRIYYTLRYLEGHLRAIEVMGKLGIPTLLDKRGKEIVVDWMHNILVKMEDLECK